jgi:DNA primase
MAHQYGFTETVAALGTAFTATQLGVLRRYCDEVVTFFDADAAGRKAAERAEELLEPTGSGLTWSVNRSGTFESSGILRVKVALLPAGHDPDTFLRASGSEAFAERITNARSLLSYALDRTIGESDTAGARGRVNTFNRVALMLSKVSDAQEAAALSREAALKLGVDPTQLWIEAQRLQAALRRPPVVAGTATTTLPPGQFETDLITLLLVLPEARTALLPLVEAADVTHKGLWTIVSTLQQHPEVPAEALLAELEAQDVKDLLAKLLIEEREIADRPAAIEQFRRRLERARRLRRLRTVSRTVAEAQSHAASSAVPMDSSVIVELHQEGAGVHELVGGAPQALSVPAIQSELDPSRSQGVTTHE